MFRQQIARRRQFPLWFFVVLASVAPSTVFAQLGFTFQDKLPGAVSSYRATAGDNHGPGATFTDLDHDGYPDLVLVSGPDKPGFIYRNVPQSANPELRTLVEVQQLPARPYGSTGVVAGDYDGDGDLDLYVLNHPFYNLNVIPGFSFTPLDFAPNELWQNQHAQTGELTFLDVTAATDPTPGTADEQFGLSHARRGGIDLDNSLTAAWADVDLDGDLDLFVGNHDGTVGGPHENMIPGQRDILYLNNGDGTFTDATEAYGGHGFESPAGDVCAANQCFSSANASIFADFDNDGWSDLLVVNKLNNPGVDIDTLYLNLGLDSAGRWRGFDVATYDMSQPFGFASDNAMGVDAGDLDNDGDLDIYLSDLVCEYNGVCDPDAPPNDLFTNRLAQTGSLDFSESTSAFGVASRFSWGVQWLDVDNDGLLDLHVATHEGHRDQLFVREGSSFVDRGPALGLDQLENSRGSLAADWDRDGAIDLFVVNVNPPNVAHGGGGDRSKLYENGLAAGSSGRNFLSFTLSADPDLPPNGNRSTSRHAIGARVEVTATIGGESVTQLREVRSGNGNAASTASLDLEFGIGSASSATARVLWPSGRISNLGTIQANQFVAISEAALSAPTTIGENGQISLTHVEQTISFGRSYTNPVVFAQPVEFRGSNQAVVRIRDVTSTSAKLRIVEAPDHDGSHISETIHWFVFEAGRWQLGDGTRLDVGTVQTAATISAGAGSWERVDLPAPVGATDARPAVMSQIQTSVDPGYVKTRQSPVTATRFLVAQESADSLGGSQPLETIGYLAIEPSRGRWSGRPYSVGLTPRAVTHEFYRVEFGHDLGSSPHVLASMATRYGADGAALRYRNLTSSHVEVKVEEDTTVDPEVDHTTEQVAFLAVAGTGSLFGRAATTDPAPSVDFSASCGGLFCSFVPSVTDDDPIPPQSWSWHFGDGEFSAVPSTSHSFPSAGSWDVTLRVTDRDGQTRSRTRKVSTTAASSPPTANFTATCTNLSCTFDASSSNDDFAIPSSGYRWNFNDGSTAVGRIVSHAFERAGTMPVELTVVDSHGQEDRISKEVTTSLSVSLLATYKASLSNPNRTTRTIPNAGAIDFDIAFDPNLGRFSERPGAGCQHGRPENPTYLKVGLGALPAGVEINRCDVRGSWDDDFFDCPQSTVDDLNQGLELIINTDDLLIQESDCSPTSTVHVPYGAEQQLIVTLYVNNVPYIREFGFTQTVEMHYATADQDTWVNEAAPTTAYGNNQTLSTQPGPSVARYGFTRFNIGSLPGPVASAQLGLWTVNGMNAGTSLEVYDLANDNWSESALTWNTWATQTGGPRGGPIATPSGWASNRYRRVDVTPSLPTGSLWSFGLVPAPPGTSDVVSFASSEHPNLPKPRLAIAVER
ncbi:MAG: FG-GAP-like repeat-containing protein [Acidobacteriota bacterium]